MKKNLIKFAIAGMALMMPICQLTLNAEELKIVIKDYLMNLNQKEEAYHRLPLSIFV